MREPRTWESVYESCLTQLKSAAPLRMSERTWHSLEQLGTPTYERALLRVWHALRFGERPAPHEVHWVHSSSRYWVFILVGPQGADPRLVKVAMPPSGDLTDEVIREQLAREASHQAELEHSGRAGVFGCRDIAGRPGIFQAFETGATLQQQVDLHGCLSEIEGVAWIRSLADVVAALHNNGKVHRDLAPGNTYRVHVQGRPTGRAMPLDFGETLTIEEARAQSPGTSRRTVGFAAPERVDRTRSADYSPIHDDIFGLGALLFFALTGEPRYDESENAVRFRPLDGRDLSNAAREILAKATDPNPHDRYESIEQLKSALSAFLSGSSDPRPVRLKEVRFDASARVRESFVGRESEREQLRSLLQARSCPSSDMAPIVVSGDFGTGKSFLVDRVAFELQDDFPGGYIRISLDPEREVLADSLVEHIFRALFGATTTSRGMAACAREAMTTLRTLLHVENVDDPRSMEAVIRLFEQLEGVPRIATSRLKSAGPHSWSRIRLSDFDLRDTKKQLTRELELRNGPALGDEDVRTLHDELGGRPQALSLAAAFLGDGYSVADFVRELNRRELDVDLESEGVLESEDRPTHSVDLPAPSSLGRRSNLAKTIDISLGHLERRLGAEGPKLCTALDAVGYLPRGGFGSSLMAAAAGLQPLEWKRLSVAAEKLSLLEAARATAPVELGGFSDERFRVHTLLAKLARFRAKSADLESAIRDRIADWFLLRLAPMPPNPTLPDRSRWNEVSSETDALVALLEETRPRRMESILSEGADFALIRGPFAAWSKLCERALETADDVDFRLLLLNLKSRLAEVTGAIGEAVEAARDMHRLALEGQRPPAAAVALGRIAEIHHLRGELDDAMRILQEEVMPVNEQLGDVRSRAKTLGWIADIHRLRGRPNDAMRILQEEVLPVHRQLEDVRSQADTLGRIADIHRLRGELDDAMRIFQEEVLPVYDQLGDVRARAIALGRIADIHRLRGKLDEAMRIFQEEVLPVHERLEDLRSQAKTLGWISDIHRLYGQLDDAMGILQEQVLPVHEKLGDLRSRAITLGRIAEIHRLRGQLHEAMRIQQESVLPVHKQLGDLRSQAITLGRIAETHRLYGQLDEAMRILQEKVLPAYEDQGDVFGLLGAKLSLARTMALRGQSDELPTIRRLLAEALRAARMMRVPEAAEIKTLMREMGMDPD